MFFLTPRQAKQLRSMLRATLLDKEVKGQWPVLHFHARPDGTTVEAQKGDVALRWRLPYRDSGPDLAFRSTVLADLEGTGNAPIRLDASDEAHGRATWEAGGAPRTVEFETVAAESLPRFTDEPTKFRPTAAEFSAVLREAYLTAAKPVARLSLSRIQLRGSASEVVATDGRQLLIHRNCSLPWREDVLIPSVKLFGRKTAWTDNDIHIGKSKTHVFLRCGDWDVVLRIDTDTRYPAVDKVLPKQGSCKARLVLDRQDVEQLIEALPELPGNDADHEPVTIDFRNPPSIRGEDSSASTEIELSRSCSEGDSVVICQHRGYLRRALELGFREIRVRDGESPLWCQERDRLYLWMPLEGEQSAPATQSTERISTSPSATTTNPKKGKPTMTKRNGQATDSSSVAPTLDELIAEAEEMRRMHQEFGSRLSRLLAALKSQRKQSRLLRQAVASIQGLDLGG